MTTLSNNCPKDKFFDVLFAVSNTTHDQRNLILKHFENKEGQTFLESLSAKASEDKDLLEKVENRLKQTPTHAPQYGTNASYIIYEMKGQEKLVRDPESCTLQCVYTLSCTVPTQRSTTCF